VSKRSAARRTRYYPLNYDALKYSSIFILIFILIVNVQVGSSKPFVTALFKAKVVEPWNIPTKNDTTINPNQENTSSTPSAEVNIYDEWNKKIVTGLQAITLPNGLQPSLSELDSDRSSRWDLCLTSDQNNPKCNLGLDNAPKKIYVLGDSYALSAIPMIFGSFYDSQFQVITRIRGQCMIPDVQTIDKGKPDLKCAKFREQVNQEIKSEQPFLVIALSLNSNLITGNLNTLKNGMLKEYRFLVNNADHVVVIGETPFTTDPRSCVKSENKIQTKMIKRFEPENKN
jgi:hypothetical protein